MITSSWQHWQKTNKYVVHCGDFAKVIEINNINKNWAMHLIMLKGLLYSILLLVPIICEAEPTQRPIVGIEMDEAGMHRELLYTVQFDYPLAGKECEYMLEQTLPAAVYVSTDQLADLKRLNKLHIKYPRFVDIEVSTERANPLIILLPGTPKITDSIKLPIHFRYHSPKDKKNFIIVYINPPAMYMNCLDEDNELATMSDTMYCLNEHSDGFEELDDTSSGQNAENCNWKHIKVELQLKTKLRAQIPVGNTKLKPSILFATIILSWIVSLWTIYRTHTIPRRINHKLNEQRLLQEKFK